MTVLNRDGDSGISTSSELFKLKKTWDYHFQITPVVSFSIWWIKKSKIPLCQCWDQWVSMIMMSLSVHPATGINRGSPDMSDHHWKSSFLDSNDLMLQKWKKRILESNEYNFLHNFLGFGTDRIRVSVTIKVVESSRCCAGVS